MTIESDYSSIPRTYREYLELMQREGEFLAIDEEIDWKFEIGAICRRAAETLSPSPIFNKVKDCPGFRAAEFGMQKSGTIGRPWARLAPFVGMPLDADIMEMQQAVINSMENNKVHPPIILENKDAPCKENKWIGDEIDLEKIPAPLQHRGDAERMMQSCGLNICQTPDGKWTNWSINRSALHDKKTMKGFWLANQHNGMIHIMWKDNGEDMPFALALGVPPVCAYQGASRIPDYEDEYDAASQMLNAPIEMVKCETNDLLVPAASEIVIEGTVSATELLDEGPYGEWAGYYFDEHKTPKPRQDITCVTFRDNAIFPTMVPGVPPSSTAIQIAFCNSVDMVIALKKKGFPVIDGLATFESSGEWFVLRVKNNWHELTGWGLDEFMNRLGNFVWNDHIGGCLGKIIVVGEDINPSDPLAVTWAFATRNHPEKGTFYFPDAKNYGLGPEGYHSATDFIGRSGVCGQKPVAGCVAIYSCIGLEEHVGQSQPHILTFLRDWPKETKEKVLANWERWGFHTPDPVQQKHAEQSTPWTYFNSSGEGETGKKEHP